MKNDARNRWILVGGDRAAAKKQCGETLEEVLKKAIRDHYPHVDDGMIHCSIQSPAYGNGVTACVHFDDDDGMEKYPLPATDELPDCPVATFMYMDAAASNDNRKTLCDVFIVFGKSWKAADNAIEIISRKCDVSLLRRCLRISKGLNACIFQASRKNLRESFQHFYNEAGDEWFIISEDYMIDAEWLRESRIAHAEGVIAAFEGKDAEDHPWQNEMHETMVDRTICYDYPDKVKVLIAAWNRGHNEGTCEMRGIEDHSNNSKNKSSRNRVMEDSIPALCKTESDAYLDGVRWAKTYPKMKNRALCDEENEGEGNVRTG